MNHFNAILPDGEFIRLSEKTNCQLNRSMFVLVSEQILLQILLTPPDEGPRVKGQRIKLQDIVDGLYKPQPINGTWINCKYKFDEIDRLSADNNKT